MPLESATTLRDAILGEMSFATVSTFSSLAPFSNLIRLHLGPGSCVSGCFCSSFAGSASKADVLTMQISSPLFRPKSQLAFITGPSFSIVHHAIS